MERLSYLLNSGKNSKFKYYFVNYLRLITPRCIFRWRRERILRGWQDRPDADYIRQRVDYYNRLLPDAFERCEKWAETACPVGKQPMCGQKAYFFDTFQYTRYFSPRLLWNLCPGDVTFVPEVPSIVKSRPIAGDNANSVLLNLNKVRHFIFVNDKIPFTQKENKAVFRGKVGTPEHGFKPNRHRFITMYQHHPMCDLGVIGRSDHPEWKSEKMTIAQHLKYKFIMALEGNDVASNLKWVMSSNSLAVMPRPTYETWFMEGTLIPNYHYVEIKPDFSDLEERLTYYINHPDEAQQIINHAHEYVQQFQNPKRERLISLLVLDKYFKQS